MGLKEQQDFLTRYIRNPAFREGWTGDRRAELAAEIGLTKADLEIAEAVPLEDLDKTAEGFRDDRLNKRKTEFLQFIEHIGQYGPVDQFLAEFDAAYPEGLETQPLEMDRFITFATYFILNNGLPDYLIELLRFCYHYCRVAVTPVGIPDHLVEYPRTSGLRPFYSVKLCDPHRLRQFRYDLLTIASSDPQPDWPEQQTAILFVKNHKTFKRSSIWRVSDLPGVVAQLIDGPQMLFDLLPQYGADGFSTGAEQLLSFADGSIVEFTMPPHFNPGV